MIYSMCVGWSIDVEYWRLCVCIYLCFVSRYSIDVYDGNFHKCSAQKNQFTKYIIATLIFRFVCTGSRKEFVSFRIHCNSPQYFNDFSTLFLKNKFETREVNRNVETNSKTETDDALWQKIIMKRWRNLKRQMVDHIWFYMNLYPHNRHFYCDPTRIKTVFLCKCTLWIAVML